MKNQNDKTTIAHDCTWARLADDWDFETACGNYFEDVEMMDFAACGLVFCPFCGQQIDWQVVNGTGLL